MSPSDEPATHPSGWVVWRFEDNQISSRNLLTCVTHLWLDTDMTRNTNPMANDGMWAKVGDKTYRHESGITIAYNHNAWLWVIEGQTVGYKTLGVAKYNAEKLVVA